MIILYKMVGGGGGGRMKRINYSLLEKIKDGNQTLGGGGQVKLIEVIEK